jgi:hypothetical protein
MPSHPRTTNVPKPTLDTTMCDFAEIETTTWAFHVWNFGQGHIFRSSRMVQMYRTYIYVLLDEGNKTLQQQHHNKTMSRNGLIEWIMKCYHFAIVETLNLAAHVYNRVCKLSMEGPCCSPISTGILLLHLYPGTDIVLSFVVRVRGVFQP